MDIRTSMLLASTHTSAHRPLQEDSLLPLPLYKLLFLFPFETLLKTLLTNPNQQAKKATTQSHYLHTQDVILLPNPNTTLGYRVPHKRARRSSSRDTSTKDPHDILHPRGHHHHVHKRRRRRNLSRSGEYFARCKLLPYHSFFLNCPTVMKVD